MLQQSGHLCFALMRWAQWPSLARKVPWAHLRSDLGCGRVTSSCPTFNFSSTMAQAQKTSKEEFLVQPQNNSNNRLETSIEKKNQSVKTSVAEAGTLNELLELVDRHDLSADNLKEVVGKLSDWKAMGKIKDEDFVDDPRYVQIMKMMHGPSPRKLQVRATRYPQDRGDTSESSELKEVLKVKSLSRAMELAQAFDCKQQLAVLKNLAYGSHRPVPLLKSLGEGIGKKIETLNMKDITDVFFSLSKLNFLHEDLLTKSCNQLRKHLQDSKGSNKQHAVVGSAITSLRKLQWRNEGVLEELSLWLEKNISGFRNPSSLLYTLAMLNYLPSNHDKLFSDIWNQTKQDSSDFNDQVAVVWSLLVLQQATAEHLDFVLSPASIGHLKADSVYIPTMKKLLNINASSKSLIKNYQGARLPPNTLDAEQKLDFSSIKQTLVARTVDILFRKMDPGLFATSVPTKMGFSIDLVFNIDSKGTAVSLLSKSPNNTRVAVIVLTFQECCQPDNTPLGFKVLEKRLLESQGYSVIICPYHQLVADKTPKETHAFFKAEIQKVLSSS